MSFLKKVLCLALALTLCCTMAFAEADVSDADRIAELEALVELYKPYYDAQIIAEYDGGVIFLDDVLEEYSYIEDMYAQYGISLSDYGYDTEIKQDCVQTLVQSAVLAMKAAELGLDQLDEATLADLEVKADENFENYIESIKSYFESDDADEDKVREDSIAYLESLGYTRDAILESLKLSYVDEALYDYVTADVIVTEEDIQAAYEEQLASDKESYTSDYTYNTSRNNGATILWNPEGYRQIKHVLIMFDDDQSTLYSELNSTLTSLEDELDAILNPAETEEPAEDTEDAEVAETRTEEEVRADIDAVQADIDALYAELLPEAQEVIDKFNVGTSFADLIEAYNDDPGMQNEPTKTNGYAVSADSIVWETPFTEGAMSLSAVGDISEPVYGSNGIHIIYYEADITPGDVALDVVRESLELSALETKLSSTYSDTVNAWISAANPVYHYDRLAG